VVAITDLSSDGPFIEHMPKIFVFRLDGARASGYAAGRLSQG
jgi:hypothetical protein